MTAYWMPDATKIDLSATRGYGPFHVGGFLGVALHVNVAENGTPDSFWRDNPESVCPNFQVMKSTAAGGIRQLLPFNWQPWCQVAGNRTFAAIETAGMPNEPLTDYQIHAIAQILAVYHTRHNLVLEVTDSPTKPGFGTHSMGGAAWGGHSCPGPIRAAQRPAILAAARALLTPPPVHPPTGPPLTLTTTDQAWIDRRIAAALAKK